MTRLREGGCTRAWRPPRPLAPRPPQSACPRADDGHADAELAAACDDIDKQVKLDPAKVKTQALACITYTTDAQTVSDDNAALAWDGAWMARRATGRGGHWRCAANCESYGCEEVGDHGSCAQDCQIVC